MILENEEETLYVDPDDLDVQITDEPEVLYTPLTSQVYVHQLTGEPGPKGDKGDPGDGNLDDLADLVLIYENGLI